VINVTTTAAVAVGATTMTISAPVQAIPLLSTFRSATDSVHRVVGWNSGTDTVTFSPALPTSGNLANGAAVTFISPGVLVSRGDGSTGLDIYTVNSTRVRITGTFTWNAWAEQLVLAANCPAQIGQSSLSVTTAQLIFAGTITINGSRSSWGFGSGAVCPTPALIASLQGDQSLGNACISTASGTLTINSAAIQGASFITVSATYNNATFINSDGAQGGSGNVLFTDGTYNGITINGYRWSIQSLTPGATLSNITLIGANAIDVGSVNNITYSDLSAASQPTVFNLRSGFGATGVGNIYITGRNTTLGSGTGVSQFADAHPQVGGFLILSKQVNHSIKNIAGTALSGVRIASRDTLNGSNIDWATYYPNLTSAWNGAAQKTYSWTTSGAGTGTTQAMILAHVATSTRRSVNLTAFAKGAFNAGTTSIVLDDNGTNTFTNNFRVGTVVSNTSFTLRITLSGSRTTSIPLYSSFIYNGVIYTNNAAGTLVSGTTFDLSSLSPSGLPTIPVGTTIVLGIGIQFVSSFVHQGTRHIITAVTPANDNDTIEYQCTITPALAANLADNTQLTIQNLYTDYRNKTGVAGADAFDFYTSSYLHLPQQQELTLTGTGTLTNNWQFVNDASITQATKATVDAYTTITTAAQFYDRAKSWWYDNFENLPTSQQGVLLVDRTGTLLDAGAYNITLNNTAGAVFAFASSTITIKTATFTDTLTTTGTITLSQTGTYSAGIVPATGTVAIAAAGTYDLSGWTFTSGATISNTSGGAVIVWLTPSQVANATGTGSPAPTIIAKPQPLTAPDFADGTRAYAARVQSFTIASTDINASTDTITLGNDSQGRTAAFATAAPWTQVRFSLNAGATPPTTTGSVLKDGGFYYWSGGQLYTSLANIPSTPVDFTSQGTGNFTLLAETELFNTVVSGGAGLSQSLVQSNGIAIRLKATYWVESSGTATASVFYDSRDSLLTWSDTSGLAVGATIGPTAPEAVHEAIVAASGIQSNKYGLLTPANTGSGLSQFTIALEGVGTLQINSNDTDGVELLQNIFLWWCWIRATEAGIRIASYDTLQALSFTSYQAGRVEVENTNSTTPLTIAGGSITFPGTSTGIAATSFAINLNADVQGVVAITGLSAADLRSAVGLTSANLDSQLSDITALVL
jgi:hypothetical protein